MNYMQQQKSSQSYWQHCLPHAVVQKREIISCSCAIMILQVVAACSLAIANWFNSQLFCNTTKSNSQLFSDSSCTQQNNLNLATEISKNLMQQILAIIVFFAVAVAFYACRMYDIINTASNWSNSKLEKCQCLHIWLGIHVSFTL